MASIRREILVDADPDRVWQAVRDVGAVHRRLVPGLVADVRLEAGARVVTFANGMVIRELVVAIDDAARRLAYAAVAGGRTTHHHASMQVLAEPDGRARLVWIADLLPDDAAESVAALMDLGAGIMKKTLERKG